MIGITKHIAAEYGKFGIRCNAVQPGTVETALTRDLLAEIPTDNIPLRRFAQPAEIAEMVCFLASENASFVNGASVPVDGGFLAQ